MPTVRTKQGTTKVETRALLGWRDLLESVEVFVADCNPGELAVADADRLQRVVDAIRMLTREVEGRGT